MMGDMVQRGRTLYVSNNPPVVSAVMSLEESRRTQRPYRYGMILLCVGALVNWLGLAEHYSEPIRYTGVACILAGACLICTAMCCWLHTPNRTGSSNENDGQIQVIGTADERRCEKPPDYDSVAVAPPSYDDAIKLDPTALLHLSMVVNNNSTTPATTTSNTPASVAATSPTTTSPSSSSTFSAFSSALLGRSVDRSSAVNSPVVASFSTENEKLREKPPPYEAASVVHLPPQPPTIVAAIPVELNPAIVVPGSN